MATPDQIAAQKALLPRSWGRFGKAIDELADLTDPDEQLLAACVTLNPKFEHRAITLAGGMLEMTDATNVVVAATDQRMVVVQTGMSGAPRGHFDIAYDDLEVVGSGKKEFTLKWPDGQARFHGAAKPMVEPLLEAIAAHTKRHS
jgi:hypothetical protein